ncbi:MAG: UDP-N-acetylmuramoyl-L-alanyl-D-glutamate--2,6-diaminopimelate ligase [Phycisphaerales bacterium]
MDLSKLISGLDLRVVGDVAGVRVCDITEDSRTAVPGSLFVARAGGDVDGRAFVSAAVDCGAVAVLSDTDDLEFPPGTSALILVSDSVSRDAAVLAERFYGNPTSKLMVVGVTGTNGKTSVATMTRAILQASNIRCGMIGGVEIDDGHEIAPASMTTPPAVELSRTFASMVEAGCVAATMEVSSHALDQRRVGGLAFDVAVFTNLSGDHLDYHKTEDAYFAAKRRLFEMLPGDGVRVLNIDDAHGAALATGGDSLRCSVRSDSEAGWRVHIKSGDLHGLSLVIDSPIGPIRPPSGRVEAVGAHNAMNVLQSVASADAVLARLGHDADDRRVMLGRGLDVVRSPRGRLERVSGSSDDLVVFVDFAHTDDALASSLASVRALMEADQELWVVFGCGGDKDRTKRPRMGRVAGELADVAIVTSDNPRKESPFTIVEEVLSGVSASDRDHMVVHVDRGVAVRYAVTESPRNSVVVIAGKGHETDQVSSDGMGGLVSRKFDDADEARRVLRERRLRAGSGDGARA